MIGGDSKSIESSKGCEPVFAMLFVPDECPAFDKCGDGMLLLDSVALSLGRKEGISRDL